MDHTNKDVVGANCGRNGAGELVLTSEHNMKAAPQVSATLIHKTPRKLNAARLLAHLPA